MKHVTMPIQSMPIGGTATIIGVHGPEASVQRIHELGLVAGTDVRVIRKAPFNGPIELSVRGTHLGLRLVEGLTIMVQVHEQ